MINPERKEYGLYIAITAIVLVVLSLSYIFITGEVENKQKKHSQSVIIKNNKDNAEVIDNQGNLLKDSEIDIEEIEKRLDELDINLDDIFEQLDEK